MTTKITDELYALLRAVRCTDGRCVFRSPHQSDGMVTNGGCRCLGEHQRDAVEATRARAVRRVISLLVHLAPPPTPTEASR